MGDGSYLTYKYLSKEKQKSVPPHFSDVGRFWGATRGIVKPERGMDADEFNRLFEDTINTQTGEFVAAEKHRDRFFRDLRNFHEKRVNNARKKDFEIKKAKGLRYLHYPKKFKSPLRKCSNAMINNGWKFYKQWFDYYQSGFEIPF